MLLDKDNYLAVGESYKVLKQIKLRTNLGTSVLQFIFLHGSCLKISILKQFVLLFCRL